MKTNSVKRTFAMAFSAFALSSAFVGCTDYTEFTEGELRQELISKQYDEAFIEKFGVPAEGHTFGMGDVLKPIVGGLVTRADVGSGAVNTQRNMWAMRNSYPLGEWNTSQQGVIARDVKIPGWPNFNGMYYSSSGAGALQRIYDKDGKLEWSAITGEGKGSKTLSGSDQPVGDVTEFEIQYVSGWFRTHPKGTKEFEDARVNLHLSDFFVQNVSVDNDQDDYGTLSNSTWGTNGNDLKRAKDFVTDAYPLSDGWRTRRNISRRGDSNEELNFRMDQLQFKSIGGENYGGENNDSWNPGNGWTHINNFNNQNSNFSPELSSTNPNREIKYITSAGTEDFACKASMGNHWMNDWVLVRLVWKEDGVVRVGYYLAFDFNTHTGDTKITGDGYYSNWIIKITPAHFNPQSESVRRVMCEDLGGAFDFDFNDVVFDVAFASSNEAIISVQAAGGTMPIIVGVDPTTSGSENYEIHKLLDNVNGDMKPINVGNYTTVFPKTHIVSNYRVPVSGNTVNDVKIYVKNTVNGATSYAPINLSTNERTDLGSGDEKPSSQIDKTKEMAPRAFAVPLHGGIKIVGEGDQEFTRDFETQWMQENKSIVSSYYEFNEWVKDPTKKFGLTTDTGDPVREWYEVNITADNLFMKKADPTAEGEGVTPSAWRPTFVYTGTNAGNSPLAYAHSMLKLDAYRGADAIWKEFAQNEAQMMTHTIVFETNRVLAENEVIEAILIPADIKQLSEDKTQLLYKGGEFVTYSSEEEFKKIAITGYTDDEQNYHASVFQRWQPAVHNVGYETGTNPRHIYTCRFSFSKDDLTCIPGDNHTSGLMEYLLLYIKAPSDVTVTVPQLLTGDNPKWEWYIHY